MMDGGSARRPQLRVEDPCDGPRGEARRDRGEARGGGREDGRHGATNPRAQERELPPIDREVRKERPADPAAALATRRKNAELRATRVVSEDIPHKVPAAERTCPKCDGSDLRPVGDGKASVVLDYVPGYIRRRQHIRETLACLCGEHIVTAPGPDHSVEGARYGDSFRAFVVTSKCADSIPLYRQAKQMSRLGIPISRSTLTDLFHQVCSSAGAAVEAAARIGGRGRGGAGR